MKQNYHETKSLYSVLYMKLNYLETKSFYSVLYMKPNYLETKSLRVPLGVTAIDVYSSFNASNQLLYLF